MKMRIALLVTLSLFLSYASFSQSGWTQLQAVTSNSLKSIFFLDSNLGLIVGSNGTILKTLNSGISWEVKAVGYKELNKVFFIDNMKGWIVGGSVHPMSCDRIILRTINGGLNWLIVVDDLEPPLNSLYFADSLKGWTGTCDGQILKTTNGGINFFVQQSIVPCCDSYFANENTGYVGGYPYINKTTNGGNNWIQIYYVGTSNIQTLTFLNIFTGFCAGFGTILKTTDAGRTGLHLSIKIIILD